MKKIVTTLRDGRQDLAHAWVTETFGPDHANDLRQRAIRFLEEAIELYQACGGDQHLARNLVDYIYKRDVGDIYKEVGDVGFMLLSVSSAAGVSADSAEDQIFERNLATPKKEMTDRNIAKNEAGFDAGAYPKE